MLPSVFLFVPLVLATGSVIVSGKCFFLTKYSFNETYFTHVSKTTTIKKSLKNIIIIIIIIIIITRTSLYSGELLLDG